MTQVTQGLEDRRGITRRRMIGYLIAGPTLIAAARWEFPASAQAAILSTQLVDHYDLSDLLTDAARPTNALLTVTVNPDGTAAFALPRAEVGQGITTAVAMTIADEMDLPIDKVHITLADAQPELVWNQLTGGSNSMHALYEPVRMAAAIARVQLTLTAGKELGVDPSALDLHDGVFTTPDGRTISVGDLAGTAAVPATQPVAVPQLKPSGA